MKKLIFSAALVLSLTALAACGDEETKETISTEETATTTETEEVENEPTTETETEEVEKEAAEEVSSTDEEVTESELGKMTVHYKNKEVNQAFESGTVKGSLNKIQVATLEVAPDYKSMFDDQDIVTVVTAEMAVENTVDETVAFYPDQATLVTDTGKQVDADMLLSDSIGGDYLGVVKKEGNVIWVMPHDEAITSVAIHISGASDAEFNSLSEDLKLEVPVK